MAWEVVKAPTVVKCEITKEQAQFLEEFISSMSRYTEEAEIIYKKDFVLTEECQGIIKELQDLFEDYLYNLMMQENRVVLGTSYDTTNTTIIQEDERFYIEVEMNSNSYPDLEI